jgi:hypothetical protein
VNHVLKPLSRQDYFSSLLDIVLAAPNIAESGKFHRIFRNQGLRDGIALGSMNVSTRGKSCRRKGRISWASAP